MATIADLYARLDKGDDQMIALEREGQPVPEKWLRAWLALLYQYERAVAAERGAQ